MANKPMNFNHELELLCGALSNLRGGPRNEGPHAEAAAYYVQQLRLKALEQAKTKNYINVPQEMCMSFKLYSIQLKIDFDDASRHQTMMKIAKRAARQMLTQANMIADGRPPQIALQTEDYYIGVTPDTIKELDAEEEVFE